MIADDFKYVFEYCCLNPIVRKLFNYGSTKIIEVGCNTIAYDYEVVISANIHRQSQVRNLYKVLSNFLTPSKDNKWYENME